MFTVKVVALAMHPVAKEISVRLTVPTPADPHVTLIELVPAPEVILPPATDQKKILPDAVVE